VKARQLSASFAAPRARILVAGTREAVRAIRRIVGKDAEIVAAYSTVEALRRLEESLDLIVCNVRFDESRMFDFLQAVKSRAPALPIVCCRVSTAELSGPVHHAIELALDVLGIEKFVDCAPVYREKGEAGAAEALRQAILTPAT
jgi:CheY-like chemotaxis protein